MLGNKLSSKKTNLVKINDYKRKINKSVIMIFSELISDLQEELKKEYGTNQISFKEKSRYGIYKNCRDWKRSR